MVEGGGFTNQHPTLYNVDASTVLRDINLNIGTWYIYIVQKNAEGV